MLKCERFFADFRVEGKSRHFNKRDFFFHSARALCVLFYVCYYIILRFLKLVFISFLYLLFLLFSADFHDNLAKLLEQFFALHSGEFVGDHVGIRQSDDDGDAQASAAGADEEEEDGWSDSFRVVPEVPSESSDVVVQKEGGAQGENTTDEHV